MKGFSPVIAGFEFKSAFLFCKCGHLDSDEDR